MRIVTEGYKLEFVLLAFSGFLASQAATQCPPAPEDLTPCESVSCIESKDTMYIKLVCVKLASSSTLEEIYHSLRDVGHVESLKIIQPQITNFTRGMFDHTAIKDITISYTSIDSLSKNTFAGTSLEYLNLIHCDLKDKPDIIINLRYISKLKSLYITDNHISKVKRSWFEEPGHSLTLRDTLVSLSLERNDITIVEDLTFSSLSNLQHLDLSENRISRLKRTFFPQSLDSLSLAYNEIQDLPEDLFDDMDHLRFLRLEYNKIKYLEEDTFKSLFRYGHHLQIVDVQGNNINCSCYLAYLTTISKPGRFSGECDSPEELKGKSLAEIEEHDIICWDDDSDEENKI